MVEDVVSVKLELSLKSFGDCKALEHREVRVEEFRSAEAVASDVSEGLHGRLGPRPARFSRRIERDASGSLEPVARSLWVS